jgi:hypothetical protein
MDDSVRPPRCRVDRVASLASESAIPRRPSGREDARRIFAANAASSRDVACTCVPKPRARAADSRRCVQRIEYAEFHTCADCLGRPTFADPIEQVRRLADRSMSLGSNSGAANHLAPLGHIAPNPRCELFRKVVDGIATRNRIGLPYLRAFATRCGSPGLADRLPPRACREEQRRQPSSAQCQRCHTLRMSAPRATRPISSRSRERQCSELACLNERQTADPGSFSEATRQLDVSPPAVTKMVAARASSASRIAGDCRTATAS